MSNQNTQNSNISTNNQAPDNSDGRLSDHAPLLVETTLTAEPQAAFTESPENKVVIGSINEELTQHPHSHHKPTHHRPQHHWRERDEAFKPHHFQQRIQSLKPQTAKVLITPQAYKEMLLYVEIGQKEVGWLGTVTKQEDGNYLIDKTFLLEQEVTSAETELSAEDIGKMTEALLDQGDEGFEQANRLRFWGHSHVRMGTSPSGTDENTMKHRQEEGFEWYIRGIFNKLGRAEFTIYDFELGFAVCDAPWMVIEPETGRNLTPRGSSFFGGFPRFPGHRVVEEEPFFGLGQNHPLGATGQDWRQRNQASAQMHETLHQETQPGRYPNLAPELIPDEELREKIKAEFTAKVSERNYFMRGGKWWNNGQNNHLVTDAVQFVLGDPNAVNLPPSEIGQDAWPSAGNETGNLPQIFPQSHWPEEVVTDQGSYNHPRQEPMQRYRKSPEYNQTAKPGWLVRFFNFILSKN